MSGDLYYKCLYSNCGHVFSTHQLALQHHLLESSHVRAVPSFEILLEQMRRSDDFSTPDLKQRKFEVVLAPLSLEGYTIKRKSTKTPTEAKLSQLYSCHFCHPLDHIVLPKADLIRHVEREHSGVFFCHRCVIHLKESEIASHFDHFKTITWEAIQMIFPYISFQCPWCSLGYEETKYLIAHVVKHKGVFYCEEKKCQKVVNPEELRHHLPHFHHLILNNKPRLQRVTEHGEYEPFSQPYPVGLPTSEVSSAALAAAPAPTPPESSSPSSSPTEFWSQLDATLLPDLEDY